MKGADIIVTKARTLNTKVGCCCRILLTELTMPVWDLISHQPHTTYKELVDTVRVMDIVEQRESVSKDTKDKETAWITQANPSPTRVIRSFLVLICGYCD